MNIIINNIEINKYELLHYINSRKKIQAIKVLKDKTNLGLKDCKEVIDNLELNINFYDNKPFEPSKEIENNKQLIESTKPFKGKHVIKTRRNYKNYIILLLLIGLAVLTYMYLTK